MYRFACFIINIAAHIIYRIQVEGAEHIPQDGAFILCSNHIHSYDPAMLAISIKRQLRFMAKKELFRTKILGSFFRSVGAFPVDRGAADMTSYRTAMKELKSGMGLLVFSQGTRIQKLDIKGAKGGVALFAVKSKAPVIPAGISGSYRWFTKLNIRFGPAITLDDYYGGPLRAEQIDEIMAGIMAEVEKLIASVSG
ncbi:MAG: 1-acyl-sn-glycerol-3-phosphate acyltransferase [Defluviitaleaceae bacterium]|nr:1-acyl-sn-glycerol-3-phosphate acyltransferase [Defluviitaleaceae bacterium]